jgi:hypothetical protein
MAAPGAAGRQSAAPATQPSGTREWKDFNPGRGTSRTNNPLIQKDEWLLGKIKQREQASADAAVNSGKASPARYNVQASPAEYNVSQEEGEKRLRIRRKKQEN